jgi:hypothetical protein
MRRALTAVICAATLPDGRPRFRKMFILVARQNGKAVLLACMGDPTAPGGEVPGPAESTSGP